MAQLVPAPFVAKDTITITVDEVQRDIFMSLGLLNELSKKVGSPEQIPQIELDPDFRDLIMMALLAERKKSGKIITPLEALDDVDLSVEDAEALLAWATEHLMNFFVRSIKRVITLTNRHKETLEVLGSISNG